MCALVTGVQTCALPILPLNLFGAGSPSAAAISYVNGTGHTTVKYIQHSAAAHLRGNLFPTWAGPVSAAVGIEYRRESENVGADPIAAANGFSSTGNAVPRWDEHTSELQSLRRLSYAVCCVKNTI